MKLIFDYKFRFYSLHIKNDWNLPSLSLALFFFNHIEFWTGWPPFWISIGLKKQKNINHKLSPIWLKLCSVYQKKVPFILSFVKKVVIIVSTQNSYALFLLHFWSDFNVFHQLFSYKIIAKNNHYVDFIRQAVILSIYSFI